MNTIIKFLKDNPTKHITDEQINVAKTDIDKLNQLFVSQKITLRKSSQTPIRPKANQVWAVKNGYYDFLGEKQTTSHPILVYLLNDIESFEDEDFVRVTVLSPFVEMASEQDDVCNDASIAGFPFLVENWNEQPILTEILDEYIGYYESKESSEKEEKLTSAQKQFREIEISKAKFLNNSISALVGFVELNQNNEFGAVISVNGQAYFGSPEETKPELPKIENGEQSAEMPTNMYRILFNTKSKIISFKDEQIPFEIQIKKSNEGFIISVFTTDEINLSDSSNKDIASITNSERQVFFALKKGLYTLSNKTIHEPIKIRLK